MYLCLDPALNVLVSVRFLKKIIIAKVVRLKVKTKIQLPKV